MRQFLEAENQFLSIRQAAEPDAAFLKSLYRSTRTDLMQLGLPEPMLASLLEMQFSAQQAGYRNQFPDADYSIILKHGEPIGCLMADHGPSQIRLIYIAILPDQRNRGNGRCLLRALQEQARANSKEVVLSVDPQNLPAKHLYHSMGFQVVGDDGANQEMRWRG